ncbi:MAG: hypothetical protein SGCHY_001699 [Lobulomycetales sp.]
MPSRQEQEPERTPPAADSQDDQYTLETEYIVMDLGPVAAPHLEAVRHAGSAGATVKLIGIDTPTPFLQLGDAVYRGKHDLAVGCDLLLERSMSGASVFAGVNSRRMSFTQVALKKKNQAAAESVALE